MDVQKLQIKSFMKEVKHYEIPCYQRSYSWSQKDCEDIYEDIISLYHQRADDKSATHFIGSVVCQKLNNSPTSDLFIIDGQQRLTTMYLFYLALSRVAKERAKKANDSDDIDYDEFAKTIAAEIISDGNTYKRDSVVKHRFKLFKQDQVAMNALFAGNKDCFIKDSLLTKNYNFFYKTISDEEVVPLNELYEITDYVIFVRIGLEASDDAQLIFESLNSKGLELSEGDKIRNFVLMGIDQNEVKDCYEYKWLPVEQNCNSAKNKDPLSDFIQHYLTIHCNRSKVPNKRSLYVSFKDYLLAKSNNKLSSHIKINEMNELCDYSELYKRINSCSYPLYEYCDTNLKPQERSDLQFSIEQSLNGLFALDYSVHIPFTMECMRLHQQHKISGYELLSVLQLEETFFLRRMVCGRDSQGLNRLFQDWASKIHQKLPAEGLLAKLESIMCSSNSGSVSAIPNDEQFKLCLHDNDFYLKTRNSDAIKYILERFVNFSDDGKPNRELIAITAKYSIEHIMPQKLTQEWKVSLVVNAEAIHSTWLNRLANLTLLPLPFNSKNSNNSFNFKCTHEHGFANNRSPLNQEIAAIGKCEHWGPEEMETRAQSLIKKALKLWPYPKYEQNSVPNKQAELIDEENPDNVFDYCLAEEDEDKLTRTKPTGYEFMGHHYDVNGWVNLQRQLIPQLFKINPELIHSCLNDEAQKIKPLKSYLRRPEQFSDMKIDSDLLVKLDNEAWFSIRGATPVKVKVLKQLFELLGLEPKEMTIHLKRTKTQEQVSEQD